MTKSLDELGLVLDIFQNNVEEILGNDLHIRNPMVPPEDAPDFAMMVIGVMRLKNQDPEEKNEDTKRRILMLCDQMAKHMLSFAPPELLRAGMPQDEETADSFTAYEAHNLAKLCRPEGVT